MSDLIDRQAAIDVIQSFSLFGYIEEETEKIVNALKELPSAQPEREGGEWVLQTDPNSKFYNWYRCSNCGAVIGDPTSNFCSECGCDMRGDTE